MIARSEREAMSEGGKDLVTVMITSPGPQLTSHWRQNHGSTEMTRLWQTAV